MENQQLKNVKGKELVAAGHQFAANIGSDTPLIDMAKMVSQLATQLDCALVRGDELQKQCDAAVAENFSLINYIDSECYVESQRSGIYSCAGISKPATPATDAILNAVRAEGIEILADDLATPNPDLADGTNRINKAVAWYARQFASKMRTADAAKDGDHA